MRCCGGSRDPRTAWRILSHCRDAEEPEAVACLEGVHLAMRLPEIPMILESDCQTVVTKFHTKGSDRSSVASFRGDARRWNLDQNNVTHELAHFAIMSCESQCFFFLLVFRSGLCPSLVRMLLNF